MMTNDSTEISEISHDEVIQLIPWYVKGKLNASEQALVKMHLENCDTCRSEVILCQNLSKSMPAPAEPWKPSAAHFAGILAEVEKLESLAEVKPEANSRLKSKGLFHRLKAAISATPGPMRWTLALETLAIAGLVAITVLPVQYQMNRDSVAGYETLSNAGKPLNTNGKLIKLVFADDMTTKELNSLLTGNGLQLRDGPTVVGVYIVECDAANVDKSLANLKAHPKVRLALLMNL
jgi:hypothetical protein